MTKLNADDFSPIDLEDDLVREAILETTGREYTDAEIEELALEAAEQSEEFKRSRSSPSSRLVELPI